jgi:hypothetical protein
MMNPNDWGRSCNVHLNTHQTPMHMKSTVKVLFSNRFVIATLFLFFGISHTFGQHHFHLVKQLANPKELTVESMSAWFQNKPGVVIFCPNNNYDSTKYIAKALGLAQELSKLMYDGSGVYLVMFKIETASKNGLGLLSGNQREIIDQMEIVLVNAQNDRIERAKRLYGPEITAKGGGAGFERLSFVDISPTAACFNEWPDRIPFVKDFICDVFLPNYENRDAYNKLLSMMQKLDGKIDGLNNSINSLKAENENLKKEVAKISKYTVKTDTEKERLKNLITNNQKSIDVKSKDLETEKDKDKQSKFKQEIIDLQKQNRALKDELDAL